MKPNYSLLLFLVLILFFSSPSQSQTIIAQWNFNGISATAIAGGTSTPLPQLGLGTASLIGGTTATFAAGNATTGTLETEITNPPNFGWNSTNYAPSGIENKGRGVQYTVSTLGQSGIVFKFEQRLSNTSSNTYVVQYTTDNTVGNPVWTDQQTFTFSPAATGTGDTWYNGRVVDMSSVTALNNNANVAFRIVSAFDPIAGNYVAAKSTSTYAGGTVRFDMVTVTSNLSLGNVAFDASKNDFNLYPNPSNNELLTLEPAQNVEVYDLLGKLVLKIAHAQTLDTKNFRSGIYIVKTSEGKSRKLIIN